MRERSGIEIESDHVLTGNIFVHIHGKSEPERGEQGVLEIRIAVEGFGAAAQVVVHFADKIVLNERRAKTRTEASVGRSTQYNWRKGRLPGSFAVAKEEELVLDYRSTRAGTILIALVVQILSSGRSRSHRVVAEEAESFAVERVGARLGGHIDGA